MRILGSVVALMALASAAAAAPPFPDPIAPASQGKLECHTPNPATKSCESIATYEWGPDGGIRNPSTVLIPGTGLTMRTTTAVTVKDGRVCGFVRPEDLAAAEFTIAGAPASAAQTETLRGRIATAFASLFGHEICTAYVTEGGALIAKGFVDGAALPAKSDKTVIWVDPADGYAVKP